MLTEWIAEVKSILTAARGPDAELVVRVPGLPFCDAQGLDVRAWCPDGQADVVIASTGLFGKNAGDAYQRNLFNLAGALAVPGNDRGFQHGYLRALEKLAARVDPGLEEGGQTKGGIRRVRTHRWETRSAFAIAVSCRCNHDSFCAGKSGRSRNASCLVVSFA